MRSFNLVKSLTNLVTNRKGLLILCLSLATLGVENVWGAWSGSGQGTQVNGVWYALYDNTERKISPSLFGKHVEYNYKLSAPGSTLTFSAKRSKSAAVGNLRVGQNVGGTWSDIYDKNPNTSYETSGVLSLNVNATDLSFYNDYGSYDRYFKNVQVTMATYFEDPSKTSLDFGSGSINTGSVSQDFTIAWCNTGAITSSLSAHSDVYSVSISDNASAGHYGTATVTVTYNRGIKAGQHDATLTLTSGSTNKTISLNGTTTKLDPSITWSSDDATFNVDDVLSATNSNGLTVTLSSTGDKQYVNCSGNTATMLEATTGTITITAHVTGNDIYNSKSFTKDITITNKEKQYITWKQDFSKLKTTDANKSITLNAEAVDKDGNKTGLPVSYELVGDKTGLSLSKNGNTWTLTYSASACKNTTIIAKQEGNATYAPASNYSLPVKVIDPTLTCSTSEIVINSAMDLGEGSRSWNIDIPSSMTIKVERTKTGFFDIYTNGFDVELYSGINATGSCLQFEYSASEINNSKTISLSDLDINAKSVKLISHASKGYTVTSLTYTHYHYCEADKTELNYATYPNTKTEAKQVVISYANYPIEIECSSNKIEIDKSSFGDCGVAGSETINVTYTTGANTGIETEYIYVKDNTGATLKTITINVSIQKVSQNITSTSIVSSYKTTDKIELSATSNSGLTNFEYSCSPSDVASFEGNIMTFNKSCDNLSIMVTQPGDNVYSPCSTTVNNIKVSKVTPAISTKPTATITYRQQLNTVTLSGGAAKVNPFRGQATDHAVEGTFSWTNGGYTVIETGGTTHEYDVTFTPSGTEAGMYNSVQGKATVTVNKATPTLTTQNPADTKIYIDDTLTPKIDLVSCITGYSAENDAYGHTQNRSAITYSCEQPGAVIEDKKFYATAAETYTITATAPATDYYKAVSETITIVVGKHTPVFAWKTFEHIYAGQILEDVASTSYNDKPVTLDKTYESLSPVISVDTEDKTKLHISSTITKEQEAEVKVITTETPYYKSVEGTHTYTLEPKATPVFKLNGDTLSTETTTNLCLEIGETANVSFELTDESQFEYPQTTANNYFSYEHDAVNHTGVITATKFGNETFAFHQKGTATIFDHTCNLHIYVSKHQSSLSTPLVDGTWKVDSLYTSSLYSSNDPNEVIVSSSNDKVLKLTDEGLKAVGAGTATLYICQAATDDWTGDTISVNINVEKYTPEITWNIDTNLPWGSVINNPISTSNTELPYSITSSNPSISNYVNEHIEVYNTSGSVTYTFAQEGNYKWNAANSSKTITIFQPANHVPFTLSQSNYGNFVNSYNKECTWDAGLRVASTAAKYAFNWDDRYVILHFEGIPDKLYFSCSNSTASSGTDFYVCEGSSQSSLSQIWSASGAKNDVQLQLQEDTRYVKLCFSGNYAGYFSNVQVTERKEIVAPASCDFGAANVGAGASKKTISVDWYNVQTCTLTISGTNADRFSVNPTSISSSLDNYGTADIEVSYLHTVGGSHSATLTIQSADGKSATINLSGTSNKITPTITWKENLSPMEKGSSIENPAQAAGLTFSYESSDPTVIEIINGNTLHALKKGFADITATFDGTNDVTWNSASDKTTVEVTDIKVLRIDWPQSFTNLKTDKPDITIKAEVYYYNFDDSTTVAIDRPITFTSQNTNVVTIVNGAVHIVGKGETTITATVEDVENEYFGTTVIRKVRVREPSEGCDIYVLEDASGSLFTEITSFAGVEKEFNLSGEPGSITFDAWSEKWYAINPSGNLKVAEYYNGSYHTIWDQTLNVGNETSYGPIALNRKTTKIKFFKEVGSTCYHNFASAYVTLAKHLELDNTAGKTTMTVDFPESETSTDVTYTKYVDVNFSNITDVLDVNIEKGTNFKVLKQDLSSKIEEIGTDCGDKGKVTIAIQFLANEVKNYSDKITISNKDQSVTINLTAEVARHDQQITWNPTTNLLTTDQVSFSATTTATDLNVTYAIKGTSDVASVTSDGILTIYKFGKVTIVASQAGSEVYKPAVDVERTFTISRVTPTITTLPIAAEVILPKTLANCTLTGGEASVEGVFTWTNSTTNIERGNTGYEVTFTPSNLNYYTPTTCIVVVPVAKDPQTITWNFTETTMFCNADITFNATASSGLKVKYATSDASIAYVDNANHLNIIKGGEVTITAQQEGDITWAVAPEVSKVLTINRFTPTIVEIPTASPMLIGQLISNSVLTGGRAELNNVFVPGTYAWENSNTATIDVAGKTTRIVIFSPQNSNYYNSTTCEVEVEVKKYAPTITNNLTASAITYGQALSASVLNGTLTAIDNVKYPSVEVDGTYTWKEPTKQLEVGNHNEIVRFTPANLDWYDVVDVEVPVVVNKAHATTATAVVNMLYGQILDEVQPINTTTDAITGIVEGTITWGTGVDMEEMPSIGEHDYPIHLAVTDPNYVAETIDGTCHVTVEKGFVFDGHGGSTEWNTDDNWVEGTQPTTMEDKVIVTANALIVNTEVNVGAITIKQGVDVTIEEDGILNVGNYDCVSRKEYGNMIIKQGGQLNLNEGEVQVKDFTLEAALGGIKDNARVDARSGQVTNASQLVVNGNAYFEIALDASGACTQGWYDFTVPFPVNALTGVQRYENGTLRTNLKNEVNYAIMSYHEDVRAQGKYGWSKYRGIMQPGQCYSITIDNYYNVYRFVKTTDGTLNTSNEVQITATEGGEEVNKGWNGIGNGTLSYANITASDIDKVQVYDHATNSYSPVEINNTTFVVGSSFFVQTPQTESVVYNKATSIGQLYAPKQTSQVSEEFMVTLSNTRTQNEVDRLYLSASEDAIDSYEIGHDLAKFDVSSSVAQMWCSAYDMRLCDVELPLEYETALFPISFSAPTQGQYTLSVAKKGSNDHLYLLYQGYRVADLTMSDYVVDLYKGTDTNYALQLVATYQVPTQMENNEQENIVRKVIIDNQLYIFYDKKVYDITGKIIK